jgi:hypothetical protein
MIIPLNDERSIIEKVIHNLPIAPRTILVEQRKRRIPMEQHRRDLKLLLDELSNNVVVVLHALFVDRAFAEGENAWPWDGEAEGRDAEVLETGKVLLVEVVVWGGDVGGRVVGDLVGDAVAEEIPDGGAFAFGVDGTLGMLLVVLWWVKTSEHTSIWKAEEATPQEKPSGSEAALRFVS